ncbi:MAG: excinuclease ABC subunit A [Alphaproteobacteria bacterium]
MQAQTRTFWLKVASEIVIAFGLLIVLASTSSSAFPVSFLADLIFWPVDGAQAVAAPSSHLLAAIAGGVMTGWGVLLYLLTARLYPKDPDLARLLITASIGIWFVIDSLGSIAAGAPINAVLNISFLVMFLIPLWLPAARSTAGQGTRAAAES